MRRLAHLSHSAFTKLWRRVKLSSVLPAPVAIAPGHNGPLHTATMRVRRAFRKRHLAEEEIDYTKIEYAIERKLLEAPILELSYYIDTVGKVPLLPPRNPAEATNPLDIGNEDLDPEWGVDIAIHGGIVRYGPWADRQRYVAYFDYDSQWCISRLTLRACDSAHTSSEFLPHLYTMTLSLQGGSNQAISVCGLHSRFSSSLRMARRLFYPFANPLRRAFRASSPLSVH